MSFQNRDYAVGPNDSLWGDVSPLPGTNMQLLAGSEQTDGQYTLMRYTIQSEVYAHIHENEDESIFLLDGEITTTVGNTQYTLSPGGFIFMPRGVPHSIVSHTPTWKGLSISAPPVHFQACMEELLEFAKSGQEFTMDALLEIQTKHGVRNVSSQDKWYDMNA